MKWNSKWINSNQKIKIAPIPDERLDWLKVSVQTRAGTVASSWKKQEGMWHFDITVPAAAEVVIHEKRCRFQKEQVVSLRLFLINYKRDKRRTFYAQISCD